MQGLTFLLARDELAEEVDRQLVVAAEVGPHLDAQEVEALLLGRELGREGRRRHLLRCEETL